MASVFNLSINKISLFSLYGFNYYTPSQAIKVELKLNMFIAKSHVCTTLGVNKYTDPMVLVTMLWFRP